MKTSLGWSFRSVQRDPNESNAIPNEHSYYVLLLKEHLFEGQEKLSSARKITSRTVRRYKKKRKTLSSLIQMSKKMKRMRITTAKRMLTAISTAHNSSPWSRSSSASTTGLSHKSVLL
jgi:hypothetical protein